MPGPLSLYEGILGDVGFAMVVGACPTISMILCSYLFFGREVSITTEAMFQKFAAGMILTATAMELFPQLETKAASLPFVFVNLPQS